MKCRPGAPTVAVLVVLAAGGCTQGPREPASSTPSSTRGDGIVTAVHLLASKEQPAYALRSEETITGLLTADSHGCVTVERDGEAALLWAPVGSSLAADGSAVTAPTLDEELKLGETVSFQGEWTKVLTPVKAVRPRAWTRCVAGDEGTVAFVGY